MKKIVRSTLVRLLSLTIALFLLVPCFAGCASNGKTLLTMEKDGTKVTFSVNLYEFMLSRMKGYLVYNGFGADEDSFWDYKSYFNGTDLQDQNDYYQDMILENCYTYTVVMWYFKSMGLSLSDKQQEAVQSRLDDILEAHADGSKTKLNSILSTYGVNYNLLRQAFELEEMVNTVQDALYGADATMLGPEVKEAFLNEQYIHIKQIFLPLYRNVYEEDENGDEIYFVKESQTASICYDTTMFEGKDEKGLPITDKNGDQVYFTSPEQTRIAYDMEKGIRSYVLNADGTAKTEKMSDAEKAEVEQKAKDLYNSLSGCTPAEFEEAMEKNNLHDIDGSFDPLQFEYYLQKSIDYAAVDTQFAYLTDIVSAVDKMEVGAITSISSDASGYHIVMKYAPVANAYADENFDVWFTNFNSALIESVFLDECHKLFDYVKVNDKVLATATEIRRIGANYEF